MRRLGWFYFGWTPRSIAFYGDSFTDLDEWPPRLGWCLVIGPLLLAFAPFIRRSK